SKSEAYDLGFYVGQQCGLTTVRAVDWMEIEQNQNGISDAVEWAETHDEEFITKLKNLQSNHNLINTKEHIYDITLELTKPENCSIKHELYDHMMLLCDSWDVKIPWIKLWYKKNMIMVKNITRNTISH